MLDIFLLTILIVYLAYLISILHLIILYFFSMNKILIDLYIWNKGLILFLYLNYNPKFICLQNCTSNINNKLTIQLREKPTGTNMPMRSTGIKNLKRFLPKSPNISTSGSKMAPWTCVTTVWMSMQLLIPTKMQSFMNLPWPKKLGSFEI